MDQLKGVIQLGTLPRISYEFQLAITLIESDTHLKCIHDAHYNKQGHTQYGAKSKNMVLLV